MALSYCFYIIIIACIHFKRFFPKNLFVVYILFFSCFYRYLISMYNIHLTVNNVDNYNISYKNL